MVLFLEPLAVFVHMRDAVILGNMQVTVSDVRATIRYLKIPAHWSAVQLRGT